MPLNWLTISSLIALTATVSAGDDTRSFLSRRPSKQSQVKFVGSRKFAYELEVNVNSAPALRRNGVASCLANAVKDARGERTALRCGPMCHVVSNLFGF